MNDNDYGITHYLTGEDARYPVLVLQGEFGSVGYAIDASTGELRRICLCAAHGPSECCCGAWDIEDLST